MAEQLLNITIPVFNRLNTTLQTLLSLKRAKGRFPFIVTVVDNGSDSEVTEKLQELYQSKFFDKLFILPKNMGIACACNLGWDMTDAAYYMKLDNDYVLKKPDGMGKLFRLWEHGERLSTLGPIGTLDDLFEAPGAIATEHGTLGVCEKTLRGSAIIIPKVVSDIIGHWCEDYGAFGGEDGDYGLRMRFMGFKQYYYLEEDFFEDKGGTAEARDVYKKYSLDRELETKRLFQSDDGGIGPFSLNNFMYRQCIRNIKVPRRYVVQSVEQNNVVHMQEVPEYAAVKKALDDCKKLLDDRVREQGVTGIYEDSIIASLKEIMAGCGQAFA